MRTFPILLAVVLALAPPVAASAPDTARAAPQALSPAQRQAVVLMVAGRVERHLGQLPKASPQQAVAALRHVAHDYAGMSRIARDAGWNEMAVYYTETSAVFARMVKGATDRASVDRQTRALEARRQSLTRAAIARFGKAGVSPRDPRLNGIADRLVAQVERGAPR
ncbi:MAG TPA: hypothetical protein VFE72_08955 [Lysobacter sp.]|nr:hypothetical protein [Lysobacter sp.]